MPASNAGIIVIGIVRVALKRPYTIIVLAMFILIMFILIVGALLCAASIRKLG